MPVNDKAAKLLGMIVEDDIRVNAIEKFSERIAICMESGMSEEEAKAVAVADLECRLIRLTGRTREG